jgi:hypothetical protein
MELCCFHTSDNYVPRRIARLCLTTCRIHDPCSLCAHLYASNGSENPLTKFDKRHVSTIAYPVAFGAWETVTLDMSAPDHCHRMDLVSILHKTAETTISRCAMAPDERIAGRGG